MLFKLSEILADNASKIAYICGKEKVTYKELFCMAEKTAKNFLPGDNSPAVILCGKNANTLAAILACIKVKRAYVPVEGYMPEERKNEIFKASGAGVLMDCTGTSVKLINMEKPSETAGENEIAYIIFTSGSTGKPKGVPISYENLENFVEWITELYPLNSFEHVKVLNHASFSFDLSTASLYYALCSGHTFVDVENKSDIVKITETIEENKPEIFVATPTFLRLCMLNKDFSEKDFPFIKCIYFCGEMLHKSLCREIFKRFPQVRIINAYGPTEATSAVCAAEITKEMLETEEILPAGVVSLSATEVSIENKEIVLKGKSVFGGYLGNISGGHYIEEGKNCYRTGDTGFIKDEKIYCTGRIDDQIKYKGYRIELSDIESNILDIEGIENCAAIAKRTSEGEVKLIKAFVCGSITEEEIRKRLEEKLPDYMIPKSIKIIDEMPVNKNGKINRTELEKL